MDTVRVVPLATDFVWDGSHYADAWSIFTNWDRDAGCPDGADDTATVSSTTGGWPVLDDNYCTGNGTMGGNAQLNVVGYTWSVDGTFTVNGDSAVTISGTSGSVEAEQIVINGGASGTTLTVSMSSGGSVCTVPDFSCS